MMNAKSKHRVLIMTPDREFAASFLDLCHESGEHTVASACVSVSATMMLSSHYLPRMLLADIRYGEPVLRQMIRELKHENPHLVVMLVGEPGRDLHQFSCQVRADGWISSDRSDCHRLIKIIETRPVSHEGNSIRPLFPWTMPPLQPKQVFS